MENELVNSVDGGLMIEVKRMTMRVLAGYTVTPVPLNVTVWPVILYEVMVLLSVDRNRVVRDSVRADGNVTDMVSVMSSGEDSLKVTLP